MEGEDRQAAESGLGLRCRHGQQVGQEQESNGVVSPRQGPCLGEPAA